MKVLRQLFVLSLVSLFVMSLSGCAMIIAQDEMPDMSSIGVSSTRAEVEKQLGSPISDIRTSVGKSGSRKVIYKISVRTSETDASTMDKVVDGFVGFKTYEYRVIYDRNGRVVKIDMLRL